MLNKIINFVSNLFESEESKKKKIEEQRLLMGNAYYKEFKEKLNNNLPFIKVSESKNIKKVERQLTATITKEQVEQLKNIQGIDVDSMSKDLLINELISTIQKEYVEKMFAIGWESHFKIGIETGKIFNISLDPSDVKKKPKGKVKKLEEKWKKLSEDVANFNKSSEKQNKEDEPIDFEMYPVISHKGYSKKYEVGELSIRRPKFEEGDTKYENLSTVQNRLLNNISNAIKELENKNLPTREKKYRLFCNTQLGVALQDTSEYNFETNMSQQTGKPYKLGTILNETVEIWVDPYMDAKDCRVCISYLDNKLILAAEEKLDTTFIHGQDGSKAILALMYGIDYLGDFSDCITFDVYLGNIPTI
jgi:hypothetical protein